MQGVIGTVRNTWNVPHGDVVPCRNSRDQGVVCSHISSLTRRPRSCSRRLSR